MFCKRPMKGYKVDGGYTFARPYGHSGAHIRLPCGQCGGCLALRAVSMAIRMQHESLFHKDVWFITLTYADENLPPDRSIKLEHVQKFLKRLRKRISPVKIRYVYCGEYGDTTSRPHYHMIVYGLSLDDLKQISRNNNGVPQYDSEWLRSIWKKGNVLVMTADIRAMAYVAGHKQKAIESRQFLKDEHGNNLPYSVYDPETGKLQKRKRPFVAYSNKPGIGRQWFDKYWRELRNGSVFKRTYAPVFDKQTGDQLGDELKIKPMPIPNRYMLWLKEGTEEQRQLYEKLHAEHMAALETENFKGNNSPERLIVRTRVEEAKKSIAPRGTDKHPTPAMVYGHLK